MKCSIVERTYNCLFDRSLSIEDKATIREKLWYVLPLGTEVRWVENKVVIIIRNMALSEEECIQIIKACCE